MDQDPFFNKPPGQNKEELEIKTELATKKDWEKVRNLRLLALTDDDYDKEMLGSTPELVEEVRNMAKEDWEKELSSDDMFFVLSWKGSEAIGMGRAIKIKKRSWHMGAGYVKKDFRGKDIGKEMFKMRLDEIIKRGGKKVSIGVSPKNETSIHIAESFGFKKVGKIKLGLPGISMKLDLTELKDK